MNFTASRYAILFSNFENHIMHVINHEWNRSIFVASAMCFVWDTKSDLPTVYISSFAGSYNYYVDVVHLYWWGIQLTIFCIINPQMNFIGGLAGHGNVGCLWPVMLIVLVAGAGKGWWWRESVRCFYFILNRWNKKSHNDKI